MMSQPMPVCMAPPDILKYRISNTRPTTAMTRSQKHSSSSKRAQSERTTRALGHRTREYPTHSYSPPPINLILALTAESTVSRTSFRRGRLFQGGGLLRVGLRSNRDGSQMGCWVAKAAVWSMHARCGLARSEKSTQHVKVF
jgi:hypothetical protein